MTTKYHMPVLIILSYFLLSIDADRVSWPIKGDKMFYRPTPPTRCHYDQRPFCKNGINPEILSNDRVKVFYFTNPVLKRLFGDALGHLNMYHSLLGFESLLLGMNFTLEYYAYGNVMNTSFPQIDRDPEGQYHFTWCQQAGSCINQGIDRPKFDNGTEESLGGYKVLLGTMTGAQYLQFIEQIRVENVTYPLYSGFNVNFDMDGQQWIKSVDCVDFIKKAITVMIRLGANFSYPQTPDVLKVSQMFIYSEMPELLGDWKTVKQNATLVNQIADFFEIGQAAKDEEEEAERLMRMSYRLYLSNKKDGFIFFNNKYWRLKLRFPYTRIIYTDWALPV